MPDKAKRAGVSGGHRELFVSNQKRHENAETIAKAPVERRNVLTDSPAEPMEAAKGGEGGDFQIANAEFIAAVFPHLPAGASAAVCSKSGDPSVGGWPASRAEYAPLVEFATKDARQQFQSMALEAVDRFMEDAR